MTRRWTAAKFGLAMLASRAAVLLAGACTRTSGVADHVDPDVTAALDVGDSQPIDAGHCPRVPDPPAGRVWPEAGELYYEQIGLGGFSLGEAALLVGSDGTVVAIDAGNDSHDDDVAAALATLEPHLRGHAARSIDHLVVTHFHADHGGGVAGLLGRVALTGRLVHRGFVDLTPASNGSVVRAICDLLEARPGTGLALCDGPRAPCDPARWSGTYPAVACTGLGNAIELGSGAFMRFAGAGGTMAGERFESIVGPIDGNDSNGENARSVVAVITHGAFRMLIAGDLTGGGSDTQDVEGFYVPRLSRASDLDARGVDVLHAGHHGRDTSTSAQWVASLLPADGASRNVVMGISSAHVASPHASVLDTLLGGARLGDGQVWTTTVATGGATAAGLVNALGGRVIIATRNGGAFYIVQAIDPAGAVIASHSYRAIRTCRP